MQDVKMQGRHGAWLILLDSCWHVYWAVCFECRQSRSGTNAQTSGTQQKRRAKENEGPVAADSDGDGIDRFIKVLIQQYRIVRRRNAC